LLGLAHQVGDLKPSNERVFRILENRAGGYAEAIGVLVALPALPVKRLLADWMDMRVFASRACDNAIRPAQIADIGFALIFARELRHRLRERIARLYRERLWRLFLL